MKKYIKLMYQQDTEAAVLLDIGNHSLEQVHQDLKTIIFIGEYICPNILLNCRDIVWLMQKYFDYEGVTDESYFFMKSETTEQLRSKQQKKTWKIIRCIILEDEAYTPLCGREKYLQHINNGSYALFEDIKRKLTKAAYDLEDRVGFIEGRTMEQQILAIHAPYAKDIENKKLIRLWKDGSWKSTVIGIDDSRQMFDAVCQEIYTIALMVNFMDIGELDELSYAVLLERCFGHTIVSLADSTLAVNQTLDISEHNIAFGTVFLACREHSEECLKRYASEKLFNMARLEALSAVHSFAELKSEKEQLVYRKLTALCYGDFANAHMC